MQFLSYPQDFLLLPSTLHRRPLLSLQIGRTHIIQTSRNFKEKSDFQEFITLLIQAFSVFGFAEQKCTRIMTHFPPLEKHYTCALLCKKRKIYPPQFHRNELEPSHNRNSSNATFFSIMIFEGSFYFLYSILNVAKISSQSSSLLDVKMFLQFNFWTHKHEK